MVPNWVKPAELDLGAVVGRDAAGKPIRCRNLVDYIGDLQGELIFLKECARLRESRSDLHPTGDDRSLADCQSRGFVYAE